MCRLMGMGACPHSHQAQSSNWGFFNQHIWGDYDQHSQRLIDDPHWDRIRRWVRVGDNTDHWPFHMRKIYPEETLMAHPASGDWVQAGYIIDLLLTRRREHYIVWIFYGYEFALNLGGPSIKGYEEWLEEHSGLSPLIERLGLRFDADLIRLIGQPSLQAGIEFDLAQGVEGMWHE